MEPSWPVDDDHRGDWEDRLRSAGCLHIDRSYRNILALARRLPSLDLEWLMGEVARTTDPDFALQGVDRAAHRIVDGAEESLLEPRTLSRLVLLASASEQLVDYATEHLDFLAAADLRESAEPLPFHGTDADQLVHWQRGELLRVCLGELEGHLDVRDTARCLSKLADLCAAGALEIAAGGPAPFAVFAFGKWGGMELNYSSDIDLFFARDDDTDASTCEKIARRFLQILDVRGVDHLYRVDLRLRPGGPQGALVPSVTQARAELASCGGTWERMVHIRMRRVCGTLSPHSQFNEEIEDFTYSNPFRMEDIRKVKGYKELLEGTEAGRDLERREIKVGWGGIRDVEYVVQFLQLLHGAIYPEIRGGNVFRALKDLGRVGALTAVETSFLLDSYYFLRRIEHHLMLRHRRQSFLLPDAPDARRALARVGGEQDWEAFRVAFDERRNGVRELLERLLHRLFTFESEDALSEVNLILAFRPEAAEIERVFAPLGLRDPQKAYSLLRRLAYPKRKSLQAPRARQLLAHLFPHFLERLRQTPDPDQAVLLLTNCVETIGAPAVFYQMLADSPENVALFVDMFGRSRFISDLLLDHPGILDEVIDLLRTGKRVKEDDLVIELRRLLGDRTLAEATRVLHEFRAVHTLEFAILDLGARLPQFGVLKRLSLLARAVIRVVDERAYQETAARLGDLIPTDPKDPPRHVIFGLGRLGGDEMGYASDVDMILVYTGDGKTETGINEREFYTQHLQAVIASLTRAGSGGPLYPVDLRLRPRGAGGALVHSLREFRSYLESDESQVWEHQALTRSSPITGDETLAVELQHLIRSTIGRGLEDVAILAEMIDMHRRRKEGSSSKHFHIKKGPGAILDIEFLVQSALLLSEARAQDLWEPNTYLAIHLLAQKGILSDHAAAQLTHAYSFFRLVENRLSMLHRASVQHVRMDDSSLRELALRIGYSAPEGGTPESYLLEEIQYHTQQVQRIFDRRTVLH